MNEWYESLDTLAPSTSNKLNKAIVLLQMEDYNTAKAILDKISARALGQRAYLLHATWAEYYKLTGQIYEAKMAFEEAIALCRNKREQKVFRRKIEAL